MGIHVIKMPDIGEGIAEVELVAWHVKPGDAVAEDQVLADVMTDKATVEIPSPVAGKVLALGGEVGEVMAVGAELIRIEVEGAGNVKAAPAGGRKRGGAALAPRTPASGSAAAPRRRASAAVQPQRQPPRPRRRPRAAPRSRRAARRQAASPRPPCAGARGTSASSCSSCPAAARRAASRTRTSTPTLRARPARSAATGRRALRRSAHDEEAIPVIGLRRKIAQKMQEAKRRIPHFTYVEEVDVTELEALRAQLNAQVRRRARPPDAAAVR